MTKKEELAQVATKLTACAEAMMELAKALSAAPDKEAETPSAQDAETTYSFIEVRQAAADASRRGYRADVKALLTKYGLERLSELKEADYAAFMKDLEEIGNG